MTARVPARILATAVAAAICSGCATTAPAPSVSDETDMLVRQKEQILAALAPSPAATNAVAARPPNTILPGDDIHIQVWMRDRRTQFSGFPLRQAVPPSGTIFVPNLGMTAVGGRTDQEVQAAVAAHFSRILVEPTIVVEYVPRVVPEERGKAPADVVALVESNRVTVMGWVGNPNVYVFDPGWTVRDAIARAGGTREFANDKAVYLVRGSIQTPQVARVNMRRVYQGEDRRSNLLLQPNDAIYVPPVKMWRTYDFIRTVLLPITAVRDAVWVSTSVK